VSPEPSITPRPARQVPAYPGPMSGVRVLDLASSSHGCRNASAAGPSATLRQRCWSNWPRHGCRSDA